LQEYTVTPGDTLSHLAQRFYGDHYKWGKIFEANKSTMKNPNFLFIGQKLFIPS
jgi:nucleoid-associated protein YgaU